MKTKLLTIIVFALLLGNFGCDQNDSKYSLEDRINEMRPLSYIVVHNTNDGSRLNFGSNGFSFKDSKAENGFLIITGAHEPTVEYVYDLRNTVEVWVEIDRKGLQLFY